MTDNELILRARLEETERRLAVAEADLRLVRTALRSLHASAKLCLSSPSDGARVLRAAVTAVAPQLKD